MTPDPIGLKGGVNLYAYVQNDPVNRIDPFGLFDWGNPGDWEEAFEDGVDHGEISEFKCPKDCEEKAKKDKENCQTIAGFGCSAVSMRVPGSPATPIGMGCNISTDTVCDVRYRNDMRRCGTNNYAE